MAQRTLTRRRTARDTDSYTPTEPDEDNLPEDDEEDERPARGSRRSRRDSLHTQEDKPSRRSRRTRDEDDDDDEDDEPREPRPKVGGSGWGTYQKTRSKNSGFPDDFKVTDEEVLFKLLDAEPFFVYMQHWIERQGKKSFTCLESKCPLCDDAGDKPSQQICFNVIDFTDPDDPQIKVWRVGPMVADILQNFSKNKKTAPLDREDLYWSVRKERKNKKTNYFITPVKERDLEDDWDVEPLDDDALGEFRDKAYDEDAIQVSTRAELRKIASEIYDD